MTTNALAKLDRATAMLAEAKTLDEVKSIMDVAEAARTYARAAKLGLEAYNHAAEVKVRAERKAGEFLRQLERGNGNQYTVQHSSVESSTSEYREVLDDNEIPNTTAHRWQQLADMPELVFEQHIAETRGEKPITTSGIVKELRAEQTKKQREEMATNGASVSMSDRWQVHHADIRDWQTTDQFDFIITDPPYPKEYLPLYEVLAHRAVEWLKPGGLLIAMCGQSYLDEIICSMGKHIEYYWTGAYLTPGQPTPLRQVNVNTTWKPLLFFSNGKYTGKIFGDVFVSDGNDKSMHKWGQSISGMTSIITKICLPGQSILDPFSGAGTTGLAALGHGCLFTGLDVEIENVNISKGRLNDYQA